MTLGAFLVGLLFMSYQVLHLFLVPVTWALIMVYVTWPLHRGLRRLSSPYGGLSAFLMTVILALVFVLPLPWIIALLRAEVPAGYANLVGLINQGPEVLPLPGNHLPALGLAAWGALVVSQIDNLFRPLVISSSTRIPYLLVLFAVLGSIAAFGLVGIFLGPIVIAVLLAVWREWLIERAPLNPASPRSPA